MRFSYRGRKIGLNPDEALLLQKHVHAIDASLLASQVMRACEADDNVMR
jgi:hypothetical protein